MSGKLSAEEREERIHAVLSSQPGYGFFLATRGMKDERQPSIYTYFIQVVKEPRRVRPGWRSTADPHALPGPGGPIKIGCAAEPEARLSQLQTASPYKLRLMGYVPGGMKLEQELHKKYAHLNLHGEWFRATEELELDLYGMILDYEEECFG